MSKEVGKARLQAKRQKQPRKQGRTPLEYEEDPINLEPRAETLAMSREHHSHLLTDNESHEIHLQVERMSLEAQKLKQINDQHQPRSKTRSRQSPLDPITEDDIPQHESSSEHEERDDTASKVDSQDTRPYSDQSKLSPARSYNFGTSPTIIRPSV